MKGRRMSDGEGRSFLRSDAGKRIQRIGKNDDDDDETTFASRSVSNGEKRREELRQAGGHLGNSDRMIDAAELSKRYSNGSADIVEEIYRGSLGRF